MSVNDLIDYVSQYVSLNKVGEKYVGACPFHKEEVPSLVVDVPRNEWYCFGCKKRGSLKDFIELIENAQL